MFDTLRIRLTAFVLGLMDDRADIRAEADAPDRGDVPGWVLITLMTAGLVVALWALAGEAFSTMFEDAMNKVRGAG